jgi:2,3-bisphosphoglycerate-independent phosphoglycerate mutase
MKFAVVLCDGMSDLPSDMLDGKTPMDIAKKPTMDWLAANGEVGLVRTVPDGMSPGSDVANLTVLGYNTLECYTGRSPLEAANIGIDLGDDDIAFRCNLVTLSEDEDFHNKKLIDYCAGDIHTEQADILIKEIQSAFGGAEFDFYTGTSYRHCMVWHGGKTALGNITPPHDITGRVIGEYLPVHPDAAPLLSMMQRSIKILNSHPINVQRVEEGLNPANAIWLWGQGKRPSLQSYRERFGVKGSVISAVDLIKGIGRIAGMNVCDVEGATGYIDTNYEGKIAAALNELRNGQDFVFIHVEAPDECGHRGEVENKIKSIEYIDSRIIKPLFEELKALGDFNIMVLPDHPTPLKLRTHTDDPVPYLIYSNRTNTASGINSFNEVNVSKTGRLIEQGHNLINYFFNYGI